MDLPQWIKELPPVTVALVSAGVATLSALTSGASLFLNWRNSRRDRHDLTVELTWNVRSIHEHGLRSPIKQRFGEIVVTNAGRRPVHVTFIGLHLPGRRNASANLIEHGQKLDEGDPSIVIPIPQDSALEPFVGEWKKILATVATNTGRWYKSGPAWSPPTLMPGFDFDFAVLLQDFAALDKFQKGVPKGSLNG